MIKYTHKIIKGINKGTLIAVYVRMYIYREKDQEKIFSFVLSTNGRSFFELQENIEKIK